MPVHCTAQPLKMASVEARILRADGSVEELGTIAYYHRNPFKRWAWRLSQIKFFNRAKAQSQGE